MKKQHRLFVIFALMSIASIQMAFADEKPIKLSVTNLKDWGNQCDPTITLQNLSSTRIDEIRMKISGLGHNGNLLNEERAVIFATKPGRSGRAYSLTSQFANVAPRMLSIGGCRNLALVSVDTLECDIDGKTLTNEACDRLIEYIDGVVPLEGITGN